MESKRNALSSLIDQRLMDPDLFIGFHFDPTYEEGIRIVQRFNAGGKFLFIYKVNGHLFQCGPEQLGECYCFTKLERLGKNKVNRTLWDGSGHWKNISTEIVNNRNKESIGWVTKLVLLKKGKNTPTEWHLLEYRDTERADADRWVLCRIYKREKNNDSGSSGRFDPHPSASDMGAGQIYPSTSQVSSMNQIPGAGQYGYPPQGDTDDWNGFFNADFDMEELNEIINQL